MICFLNLSVTQNCCLYFIRVTHSLPKKWEGTSLFDKQNVLLLV